MMNRRQLLRTAAGVVRLLAARRGRADEGSGRVMTVAGPIEPRRMGQTLPHEHVLVDFIGADKVTRDRYDADEVFRVVLPHLEAIRRQGVRTLVDCTPAYLGRDPALLRRLSEASGLHLVTNTGYYGANGGKHLPAHARTETADALAARWLREWREGIDDTGVRPGFIKIGTDAGPLPEVNRRLVRAAARAHLASGLTIASHTGDGRAAMEELDLLREEGVDPSAFIWVHAQNERDPTQHAKAAERGAWVEFDGVAPGSVERHVTLVRSLKARGHLGRVLLSHDAGWYHVGEPGGGAFRPYTTLVADFLPALRAAGFGEQEDRRLSVDNPREAFTIRVRRHGDGPRRSAYSATTRP
jgi:phosphotriesterase-related protein